MFRVAICDDESVICSQIEEIISNFQIITNKEIEIEVFYSGEELCTVIENGYEFDLIFLDIELKLINGIETCRKIREEYKDDITQVVYISGKQGYAMDLFESRPLNFLVKPLSEEKIIKNIKRAILLSENRNSFFEFNIGKTQHRLKLNEIMYFESDDKKIRIKSTSGDYEFYGKMPDIIKILPEKGFISVHKSFFVNFLFVKESQYEFLILTNGKSLPISQPFRKHVRDTLIKNRKGL